MTAQSKKPTNTRTKQHEKQKLIPSIIALKQAGLQTQEIAETLNICRYSVWKWLKETETNTKEFNALKNDIPNQLVAGILDDMNIVKRINNRLSTIPDDEFEKINLHTLAAIKRASDVGIGIKHQHYRLASGQSTENIMMAHADIQAIKESMQSKPPVNTSG